MSETTSGWLGRLAGGLGARQLTWVFGILFVINLVVPDPIPIVDEALLGLLTLMLSRMRRPAPQPPVQDRPPMRNVTPP